MSITKREGGRKEEGTLTLHFSPIILLKHVLPVLIPFAHALPAVKSSLAHFDLNFSDSWEKFRLHTQALFMWKPFLFDVSYS